MSPLTDNEAAALAELEKLAAGLSQEEVAARLDIDQATVSRIEARALRKIRSLMQKDGTYDDWKTGLREPITTQRAIDGRPSDGMKRRVDERGGGQ